MKEQSWQSLRKAKVPKNKWPLEALMAYRRFTNPDRPTVRPPYRIKSRNDGLF